MGEGLAGDRMIVVGFETRVIRGDFDRGEVRVDIDLADSGVEWHDGGLSEDFPGSGRRRGRRVLGHDGWVRGDGWSVKVTRIRSWYNFMQLALRTQTSLAL